MIALVIACADCARLGPGGAWDWALVSGSGVLVAGALVAAVRFTVRPGETGADHVKRRILSDDDPGDAP